MHYHFKVNTYAILSINLYKFILQEHISGGECKMSSVDGSLIKQELEELKEESSVLEDMSLDLLGKHFRFLCFRVLLSVLN